MTAEEQKLFEALQLIKEMCEKNVDLHGPCGGCPCFTGEECRIAHEIPSEWILRSRVVFFE